jgi:DNA gyrase subunit A
MIINRSGLTIRMAVSGIKVAGRATQGVRLINITDGDAIAAVSVVNKSEEEQTEVPAEAQNPEQNNE